MRQEIKEAGLSKVWYPAGDRFPVTGRVTVPEGVDVSYGVQYTLDDRATAEPKDWADDADVGPGTNVSASFAFTEPVRGIVVNVERISGGSIFFTTADTGRQ